MVRDDQAAAPRRMRVALCAGEPSGDNLGAALIRALKTHWPDAEFFGIAGPRMVAEGCTAWESAESLAVMGIFEIIPHLKHLYQVRSMLVSRLKAEPPDVYIGVDFKGFNLGVEKRLKAVGIRTVQYVSPQVWAWRQGRVRTFGRAVDMILCLLPFEKPFFDKHGIPAKFVGHPLADQIPLEVDRAAMRRELGIAADVRCVALLPGSRQSEANHLSADIVRTVQWLRKRDPQLHFVAPMANAKVKATFADALRQAGVESHVQLLDGKAQAAMIASDAVLVSSGTATLEAALVKRPMVVIYRLPSLTTFLLKHLGMMKAKYFSQPNLLADQPLVPEYFNEQVCAEVLGPAVLAQLERGNDVTLHNEFLRIHQQLRRDASASAAAAIVQLVEQHH